MIDRISSEGAPAVRWIASQLQSCLPHLSLGLANRTTKDHRFTQARADVTGMRVINYGTVTQSLAAPASVAANCSRNRDQ